MAVCYTVLLIVVIFHSPLFVKCCLSCLPICTSSVCTLSVNFLFVTPSCLYRKSVCWIGCCILLPHLVFSSNWRQQDCNEETSLTMVARLQCRRVINLLWFGNATSLTMTMAARQQSPWILNSGKTAMARLRSNLLIYCGETALRYCNLLQFGGATSLTMAMAARWKSSWILDDSNTAMSAHWQPPWQQRCATRWQIPWFNVVCG